MRPPPVLEAALLFNDHKPISKPQVLHGKQRIPSPYRTPRFLRDAPDEILKDIIYPPDPFDVLVSSDERKRQQFDRLYQRYMNQIKNGCKNSYCSTPTCLSFRQRHARTPLRRYTELSARALAIHLLSERHPEDGLCRNEPASRYYCRTPSQRALQISQTDPELQKANGTVPHANGDVQPRKRMSTCLPPILLDGDAPEPKLKESPEHQVTLTGSREPFSVANKIPSTPPRRSRDGGSFTQWLFDGIGELFSPSHFAEKTISEPEIRVSTYQSKDPATRKDTGSETVSSPAAAQHENAQTLRDAPDLAQDEERSIASQNKIVPSKVVGSPADAHKHLAPDVSSSAAIRLPSRSGTRTRSQMHTDLSPDRSKITPNGDLRSGSHGPRSPSSTDSYPTLGHITRDSVLWLQNLDLEDEEARSFLSQTIYYSLHEPDRLIGLLDHWHDQTRFFKDGRYTLDIQQTFELLQAITRLTTIDELLDLVYDAIAKGYNAPASVRKLLPSSVPQQIYDIPSSETQRRIDYLSDTKLAALCAFGLHSLLVEIVSEPSVHPSAVIITRSELRWVKFSNKLIERVRLDPDICKRVLYAFDNFNSPSANRLFERVTELLSCRMAFQEIIRAGKTGNNLTRTTSRKLPNFAEILTSHLMDKPGGIYGNDLALSVIAWCQNIFGKRWNRKAVVSRSSAIGGAIQLLAAMFRRHGDLGLVVENFYLPIFEDEFSVIDMPVDWLSYKPSNKTLHLLSFSFLFRPSILTEYFRSINYSVMHKSSLHAQTTASQVGEFRRGIIPLHGEAQMRHVMDPHTTRYLVLTVSRENLVQDAFDQIWRLQRQELMRPLKVHLGMEEGEHGVDHGGVQQEFFRILFAQALDPEYGMFTIDDRTRMTWFQPCSLESLYKYEMLGIMMSIAAYNFITLPVTFPLAFYRRLLDLKVKRIAHIEDGWPDLAKGLQQLLDWDDGDVSDVFMRTYEFSFENSGTVTNIDMDFWGGETPRPPVDRKKGKEREKSTSFELPPSPAFSALENLSRSPSPDRIDAEKESGKSGAVDTGAPDQKPSTPPTPHEAPLVTNSNRKRFVSDYIYYLTEKSVLAQLDAFATGFFACLDRTAVSIFTPEALKQVIEGQPDTIPIDVDELKSITKYEDGYDKDHPVMQDFWDILRSWSPAQVRALLEFVTASDRIPVQGLSRVTFVIQKNGRVGLNGDSVGGEDESGDDPQVTIEVTTEVQVGTVVEDGNGGGGETQVGLQLDNEQNIAQETGEAVAAAGDELNHQTAIDPGPSASLAQDVLSVTADASGAAIFEQTAVVVDSSSDIIAEPKTLEVSSASQSPLDVSKSLESKDNTHASSTSSIAEIPAPSPLQNHDPGSEDAADSLQDQIFAAEATDIDAVPTTTATVSSAALPPGPKPVLGRLPTAMTCFGRLLLPEYEGGKEVMRVKLEKAIENAKGFGVA